LAALELVVGDRAVAHPERAASEGAATGATIRQVDLAFVVALKEEFRELHRWLGDQFDLVEEDGQSYYLFRVLGPTGNYQCVALFMGDMGPTTAAVVSTKLMGRWQPATVAMVGIAAGLHADIRLGDIVVATQIDAFIEGAKAVDDGDSFVLKTSGEVYRADRTILGRVQNIEFGHAGTFAAWRSGCAQDLARENLPVGELIKRGLLRPEPAIYEGHVASGPIVGASRVFGEWLKARDRSYRALEMESGGVLMAAYHKEQAPRTLVIRGISDFGDSRKAGLDAVGSGGIRRWAMNNAIGLVWALMQAGLLPRSAADPLNRGTRGPGPAMPG